VSSRIARDRQPIAKRHAQDVSSSWFWWKVVAVLVLVFGGITYRSYQMTTVFNYNARKLHRYYQFEVKKKIASYQEARYIVYQYRDKEDTLWEKLERKYGLPVKEPSIYNDLVDAEEEARYEAEKAKTAPGEAPPGGGEFFADDEEEAGGAEGAGADADADKEL
jgi:hypothetical protein